MKKHSASSTSLCVGRGVVSDEKLESMGRIFLPHLVIQMIRGEWFLGGQDEMAIVIQG